MRSGYPKVHIIGFGFVLPMSVKPNQDVLLVARKASSLHMDSAILRITMR